MQRRKIDPTFPSEAMIRRRGSRSKVIQLLIRYCRTTPGTGDAAGGRFKFFGQSVDFGDPA